MFPRVLLFIVLLAMAADAHPFLQDSMWVLFAPERIRVAVNVSLKEILVAQGIEAPDDAGFEAAQVQAAAEKHREYLPAHLHLSLGERELPGRVIGLTPPPIYASAENTYFQYEIEYPLAPPLPELIAFRHDMLREFSYAPGQAWEVSYVVRVKREGSDEVTSWMLRPNQTSELPTGWSPAAIQPPPSASSRKHGLSIWLALCAILLIAGTRLAFFLRRARRRLSTP